MAAVDPRGPAAPIFQSALTSDPDEIEIIQKDPFFYDGDILNKTAYEVLKMNAICREIVEGIKVKTPTSSRLPFLSPQNRFLSYASTGVMIKSA